MIAKEELPDQNFRILHHGSLSLLSRIIIKYVTDDDKMGKKNDCKSSESQQISAD
jgi:hypothetical protein